MSESDASTCAASSASSARYSVIRKDNSHAKDASLCAESIKYRFQLRQVSLNVALIALAMRHEVAKLAHRTATWRVVTQQSQERMHVGLAEVARHEARMKIG